MGVEIMTSAFTTLSTPVLKKAIDRYYKHLQDYKGRADYELAVRTAFLNLLNETAHQVKWLLIPEQTIEGNIRPDGVLRDNFDLKRGIWEAKGPKSDLDKEIASKIAVGYPLTNTIFENTKRAVLYQNKKRVPFEFDLHNPSQVGDLLSQFFTYTEPDIASFEVAVQEFKERVPELARALLAILEREYKQNRKFIAAFDTFAELCRASLDPKIGTDVIKEMLIQHLLTERLFSTVFDNPDFIRRNAIAAEIEKVIDALTSHSFNRHEFLKSLDRFYVAIEGAARSIDGWLERQHFLDTVYERFFQGYSVKRADTYGIVYTPQEIVDFMCASVIEVLQQEFNTSIEEPGVQIIDPCVGTGSYIVNLLHRIPTHRLKYKYEHDFFCNEIMLLAYYIASLNIEHEYYSRVGAYQPYKGICFTDTLELAESKQMSMFVEENTERIQREKEAQIMVVIGNPPYNMGQKNQNDNNKNRPYPIIDGRIRETYAKDSNATSNNRLYDAYVKFFRWAIDRLDGRDGIVCFVSNNSFIDQIAFDGMRKHLLQDFTQIYHLDLHGNVRKNPKLSGTTHNVFGIQVGVGITIAIRNSQNQEREIYYSRVPEYWRKEEKLAFLRQKSSISEIEWERLQPNKMHTWLTENLRSEFAVFLPIGTKEAKSEQIVDVHTIFKNYGRGVATCRDNWAYDFNLEALISKIKRLIEAYNSEVDRWRRRGDNNRRVDDFVTYDDTKIKWSRDLKLDLQRNHYAEFAETKVRASLYRPFCKQWLFFDRILNEEVYRFPQFFPTLSTEEENSVICMNGVGGIKPFHCLAVKYIPDLNFYSDPVQCFPYYTYAEDGSNRRENITNWALAQFQGRYGQEVNKRDIFHYLYAMLHHPQYQERYAEDLKRDLPHIPLLQGQESFLACVKIGKQLMDIHFNYEQSQEYSLKWIENRDVPFSWRVVKMKLTPDKNSVVVNESLTLAGIPQECFQYRLGNRSALDWVIDQYRVSIDKRSGIVSDPNNLDDEEYIVRLIGKVITVSVETVRLVNELAQAVKMEDWMSETVQENLS
jgi:predicted helicase